MIPKNTENIVVRFAPSPTGFFHIGSARTALFNEFFVRNKKGKLVLRIEDTDQTRNDPRYEESIINGLEWLGITYDEFYRQSERSDYYKKHLQKLIEENKAYISKEEKGERSEVIRFRNPGTDIVFDDMIRGEVKTNTEDLGDFVIAKDFDTPLYHLAVAVDDFEMGITHVVRGEDGISNTARQILIQEALGATRPIYAHIPLILAPDRSKLSKRHGAVSIDEYRKLGYLPEAMVNFLALLGWNPGTDQELFTHEELIEQFDITRVQKGGAMFNIEKLNWFNKEHLKCLPSESLHPQISAILEKFYNPEEVQALVPKITPILLERIHVLSDIENMIEEGEVKFYFNPPEYDTLKLINPKERRGEEIEKTVFKTTKEHIDKISDILEKRDPQKSGEGAFNAEAVKNMIWDYATEQGRGNVLWPMRFALSGKEKSPDPFTLAEILGYTETQNRLKTASQKLEEAV